ncbi:hypothetical protein POM88_054553 [Heracleum sosnowskyi]|uniref:Uncharacterized protein n=1 Tax=Heracleum sosnowskyi TaxID=360622 RepID=A0AAD8GNG9_9APIA|nr:hypothetical protein POM88_054553 [Heracleum sosnowskyi]
MDEVDTLALISSMLEARTQEIASLKATEPTMHPMSINEMSQVAPKTYNFCQVCGIQGHYGYECLYNVYNSQSAPLEQMNSFEEGYGYNQCSYTFDQEWMDQSNSSFMDNGVQNFPYHDQQQFEQQYYMSYEQSLMDQYHNLSLEQEYLQDPLMCFHFTREVDVSMSAPEANPKPTAESAFQAQAQSLTQNLLATAV